MKVIYKEWMHEGSWMNEETATTYNSLLNSPEKRMRNRNGRQVTPQQQAHQVRRAAFNAYLFQIIGNKHLLLAAIQHPVFSAEQPGAMLKRFTDAWKKEEESAAHQNRRRISQPVTAKRAAARSAAHEARRKFARAENRLRH